MKQMMRRFAAGDQQRQRQTMMKVGVRRIQHLPASGSCAGSQQQQQQLRLLPQAPGVAPSASADQQ
jgi:hypothetical protein